MSEPLRGGVRSWDAIANDLMTMRAQLPPWMRQWREENPIALPAVNSITTYRVVEGPAE